MVLAVSLAAAVAAAVAWLLRGAGIAGGRPAAAVVGGVLAGVLLGPAVLGRAQPELHERLLRGGVAERIALERAIARHAADRIAAVAAGPDGGEQAADLGARHAAERGPLQQEHREAVARRRAGVTGVAAVLLAIGLGLGAFAGRTPRPTAAGAVMAGCAVGAEVLFIGALAHLLGAPLGLAVAAGAAGAGGSVLAGVPMRWVPHGGRSELARGTSAMMFILAVGVVLAVSRGGGAVVAGVLVLAPVLGWMLRRAVGGRSAFRPLARGVLLWVAIPTAAAVATLHIEWEMIGATARAKLAVPAVLLLSGNAALVGLLIGGRLMAGRGGGAVRFEGLIDWYAAGFGATQVCLVLAVLSAGVLDPRTPIGSGVLAGLLLSAAIGEVTLPWLRGMMMPPERAHGE